MVAAPANSSLPNLSAPNRALLLRYIRCAENLNSLLASLAADPIPGLPALDLIDLLSWTVSPAIAPHIEAHHAHSDLLLKNLSLAALQTLLLTAEDPIEKRRAATTILRALNPAPRPSAPSPDRPRTPFDITEVSDADLDADLDDDDVDENSGDTTTHINPSPRPAATKSAPHAQPSSIPNSLPQSNTTTQSNARATPSSSPQPATTHTPAALPTPTSPSPHSQSPHAPSPTLPLPTPTARPPPCTPSFPPSPLQRSSSITQAARNSPPA